MGNSTKAVLFAFLATVFFSGEATIADMKLQRPSPLFLTFLLGIGIAVFSLVPLACISPNKIVWPNKSEYGWMLMVVILTCTADWAHFAALHYRVGATILCTSYALMPIFASMMKAEMPSLRLFFAWICAGLALLLAYQEVTTKGE